MSASSAPAAWRAVIWKRFTKCASCSKVKVYSPTKANRDRFAQEMTGKLDIEVVAVDAPEKVVRDADIVATCTDSTQTVFDNPEWLKEGAHITCVRACEVGPKVIKQCDLSVKLGRNTIEAMDEGMVRLHGNVGYIAGQPEERARIPNPAVDNYKGDYFKYFMDVRSGKVPGRQNNKQVTFLHQRRHPRTAIRRLRRQGGRAGEESQGRSGAADGVVFTGYPGLTGLKGLRRGSIIENGKL